MKDQNFFATKSEKDVLYFRQAIQQLNKAEFIRAIIR